MCFSLLYHLGFSLVATALHLLHNSVICLRNNCDDEVEEDDRENLDSYEPDEPGEKDQLGPQVLEVIYVSKVTK